VRTRDIAVIGAPLDLGAGGRRGVDMGPSAIRYAELGERVEALGHRCRDRGNVPAPIRETADPGDPHARYLDAIRSTCEEVARRVAESVREGGFPLVLGGDHSVALGTLGGLAAVHGPGAVLWIDAHGDLNTPETTPAVEATRTVLIGGRSFDDGERALIRERGLTVFTMTELDSRGVEPVVRAALEQVAGARFVHLSLDLDAIDPDFAPGVGTPVRGGLSYREAHLAMELIAEADVLDSLELVEVNPILDHENETARLAVELAASALGARIL
jgi:arginase